MKVITWFHSNSELIIRVIKNEVTVAEELSEDESDEYEDEDSDDEEQYEDEDSDDEEQYDEDSDDEEQYEDEDSDVEEQVIYITLRFRIICQLIFL